VVALVHRPSTLLWAEYRDLARTTVYRRAQHRVAVRAGRASLLTLSSRPWAGIAEVGAIIIVGGKHSRLHAN